MAARDIAIPERPLGKAINHGIFGELDELD